MSATRQRKSSQRAAIKIPPESVPITMLEEHPFAPNSSIQIDESAPRKLYGPDQSHGGYIACVTRALMSHDVKRYRQTRVLFMDLMDVIQGYRYDALDVLKRLCEALWGYPVLVRAFNESSMLPPGYRIESGDWNIITLRTPGGRVFRLTEDGFTQGTSGTRSGCLLKRTEERV